MNAPGELPFLELLRTGVAAGGFATDDALALVLPLFRQIRDAHMPAWSHRSPVSLRCC